jgi:hypothetical protein
MDNSSTTLARNTRRRVEEVEKPLLRDGGRIE